MVTEQCTHLLIGIQGLSDDDAAMSRFGKSLKKSFNPYGFDVATHKIGWTDTDTPFLEKLDRLQTFIEHNLVVFDYVSTIGPSAGGIAAVLALETNPNISAVSALSSRVNAHTDRDIETMGALGKEYPLLMEAVSLIRDIKLHPESRQKVMCLVPERGDTIPRASTRLPGGVNRTIDFTAQDHSDGVRRMIRDPKVINDIVVFMREKEKVR